MKTLLVAVALLASPAFAQQQAPDPAFMQRAITALQGQRNAAMDQAAIEKARADGLAEQVEALTKKGAPSPAPADK